MAGKHGPLYPYPNLQGERGVKYQCAYCKQRCANVALLMAHESSCAERDRKQREWRQERRRYINMQNAGWVKDHRDPQE